jgi:hypothetical protein
MNPIKTNKAKCLHCGDILISEATYEECSCGRLKIGCGRNILYRSGIEGKDYRELSEYDLDFFKKQNPNTHVPKDLPKSK